MFIIYSLIVVENQLGDCQFECKHLQTQLNRYQELNDIIPALSQIIPSLALAQLKVATEMIRQQKHKNYEGREMPLIEQ